jgi:hypothetical protein
MDGCDGNESFVQCIKIGKLPVCAKKWVVRIQKRKIKACDFA